MPKISSDKLLLDYRWTDLVDEHLREAIIDGINYKIIAPEDIAVLKIPNPREKDKEDIQKLKQIGLNNDYLQKRKIESVIIGEEVYLYEKKVSPA